MATGAPAHVNTLGVDIDRFDLGTVDGALQVLAASTEDDVLLGAVVAVLAR